MLFLGGAREERARPAAEVPASCEREQPATHEVRGEVLASDRRLVVLPPSPDVAHHGEQHVAKRTCDGERPKRSVERCLRGDVVERLDGGGELVYETLCGRDAARCRLVEGEAR